MENDLIFSGESPVVINYSGGSDDIYAPMKTSNCDISIVDEQILDDLYTAKKDGITVKIKRKIPVRQMVVKYSDQGSVISVQTGGTAQSYTIYSRDLFYTDVNGDFRFNGRIQYGGTVEEVNLLYNHTDGIWERSNDWLLDWGDQYFYVGTTSYRVTYNGSNHLISYWVGNSWSTPSPYYKVDSGVESDCAYWCDNVVHYGVNGVELVWGKYRYSWDSTNMRWVSTTAFHPKQGGDYFAIYGESAMKVKVGLVTVDALIVNALSGSSQADIASNWIVIPDRTTGEFTCYIPLTVQYGDQTEVFTDDEGYVYYVTTNGKIYTWCPEISKWVDWVTLEGDIKSNTSHLDYVITGTHKRIVIKYQNSNSEQQFFMLSNFSHPTVYEEEVIVPGEFTTETIWEGYKMPNTYSQDVTQNLDQIEMTAIDPLSILKWVTIDHILEKPNIRTYREIIGKALSYVQVDENTELWVERSVTYGSYNYLGNNGLLDLQVQVANFWNEDGDAATVYEVLEEILRPFCLTLAYVKNTFQIYSTNITINDTRYFDKYSVGLSGVLTPLNSNVGESKKLYDFEDGDWVSNNSQGATVDINTTYDKVTGVANTCAPIYSKMVSDTINYNDQDRYNVSFFNVQRNKTKGYEFKKGQTPNYRLRTDDQWYYIWNGVYSDEDYKLIAYQDIEDPEDWLDGWENINNALMYVNGTSGYPDRYGSIYNFYGGSNNPTATGKTQSEEKSVEINERITSYWLDNGTVPEYLEDADLIWNYVERYPSPQSQHQPDPYMTKTNKTDSKYGENLPGTTWPDAQSDIEVVYHQEYDNINLSAVNEQTVDIKLTQSYSRGGVDVDIDVMQTPKITDKLFFLTTTGQSGKYYAHRLYAGNVHYFPKEWNSSQVMVDDTYFHQFEVGSNNLITPVWDRRRVDMYVTYKDSNDNDVIWQFNGRNWVEDTQVRETNCFYLLKLMNYQKLFNTDYQYNIIEFNRRTVSNASVTDRYSLEDEDVVFYTDSDGAVRKKPRNNIFVTDTQHKYTPYNSEDNEWYQWIHSCSPGELSIVLPDIDMTGVKVCVDISCSSLRGECPMSSQTSTLSNRVPLTFTVDGQGYYNGSTITLTSSNCTNYGQIMQTQSTIDFIPANTAYIKAEHLDLSVSVSVPESNAGRMFSQSDIKYIAQGNHNYLEEYNDLNFKVNTKSNLVTDSYSYLIYNNEVADPGSFVINGFSARPEGFTVQAYMNWLTKIRKIYSKTILPIQDPYDFNTVRTFIKSPEITRKNWREELEEIEMMIVSDSWDLKTNRHRIQAVDDDDLQVEYIHSFAAVEVPRRARSDRWNLPTAYNK